jgi:MFS family permease
MKEISLGIRQNWQQFSLLVLVNAFVGGMIGLERAILPQYALQKFQINSQISLFSFIIIFGISKAITNYFTGKLANRFGRKNLLIIGWIFALPIPFILIYAPTWEWVLFANLLLGINQGLAWSSTVVMKIDLVGDNQRGFAMGLNEFAGYFSIALVTFLTSFIAQNYGVLVYPFYIGIGFSVIGLLMSIFLVKDTQKHQNLESKSNTIPSLKNIFRETTWLHPNLGTVTQAGLVNNLNDGLVWGIFPILLASKNFTIGQIGLIVGIYPAVWGIGQLFTGKMADRFCKKDLLFFGMLLQGLILLGLPFANSMLQFIIISSLLGFGTALVYPTFLATISENTNPEDRAESLGIFRFWRDLGYAIGAIISGILADKFGFNVAIFTISVLTLLSSGIIFYRMYCLDSKFSFTKKIFLYFTHGQSNSEKSTKRFSKKVALN